MLTLRTWLLRHLARRFQIGEDILRHLSTFQRLGEQFEVEAPQEMLPVGARTVVRALRTRAAPQVRPDWLWPHWLKQQLDPRAEAFVPRGHLAVTTNLTARNWTTVGNLYSPWEAIVDPTGLVTPWYDGWSVDWWVHAGGRWRFPSADGEVTQQLAYGASPIVETRLPVDGGHVAQRVYGQVSRPAAEPVTDELVVVELENATGGEVEVAFALRPYNPEGLAVVSDLALDGDRVLVERSVLGLLLPRPPERMALSTFAGGDSATQVAAGFAGGAGEVAVHDPAGLAQGAFVYHLPPGEVVRAAAPLLPANEQRSARTPRQRLSPPAPAAPRLVASTEVDEAWQAPLGHGLQVRVPDARLQQAIDANRAYALLLHDPGSITPGPFTYHRFWFRDAAYQVVALDRWGFHDEAADVLASFPSRQRADGFFYSQWREWDANGAAIWAIAEHHRLAGDDALLSHLAPAVMRGARWITRKRLERHRDGVEVHGLLPPGVSAEHLGPFDYYYWDDFWALRGLVDAAYVAAEVGDLATAAWATDAARSLRADVLASIERTTRRLGLRAIPAGPTRGVDAGMIGSLAACQPLDLLAADDPLITGTLDVIRDRFCIGDAFYQSISHTGYGTYLTLQLAFVELERADPRAWRRLEWLLDVATPTFTWPEAIHPQLGGGCMGDGHHGWAVADLLSFVRNVLLRERPSGVHLLGLLPDSWRGRSVAVRDAPTASGRLSYELQWDGDRPVLRWEAARDGVTLYAPSLDPTWSTIERTGEHTFAPLER